MKKLIELIACVREGPQRDLEYNSHYNFKTSTHCEQLEKESRELLFGF